jgi:hypothetical protein
MTRIGLFTGLALVFPCPWYMVAVGGLLPLPVIVVFGLSGPIHLAFSVAHAVLYTWLFWVLARRVDLIVRARRIHPGVVGALLLSGFVVLSFAPIYGSGENLIGINKLKHNAYEIYRDTWVDVLGSRRR